MFSQWDQTRALSHISSCNFICQVLVRHVCCFVMRTTLSPRRSSRPLVSISRSRTLKSIRNESSCRFGIRLDRNDSEQSPPLTFAEHREFFWCTTSPTVVPSNPSAIGYHKFSSTPTYTWTKSWWEISVTWQTRRWSRQKKGRNLRRSLGLNSGRLLQRLILMWSNALYPLPGPSRIGSWPMVLEDHLGSPAVDWGLMDQHLEATRKMVAVRMQFLGFKSWNEWWVLS